MPVFRLTRVPIHGLPFSMDSSTVTRQSSRLNERRKLACIECRRKKLRCDHGEPCKNCQRSRKSTCSYDTVRPWPTSGAGSQVVNARSGSLTPTSIDGRPARPSAQESWHDSEIGSVLVPQPSPPDRDNGIRPPATHKTEDNLCLRNATSEGLHPLLRLLSNLTTPVKALFTHSRYVLSGHWVTGTILLPPVLIWCQAELFAEQSVGWRVIQECIEHEQVLEKRLAPVRDSGQYGQHLPPMEVVERLLELYFDTFELIYRVFHIPTFLAEFCRYTQNPGEAATLFIVQLQLCLTLGALTHDDTFSFRPKAIQWMQEAEDWLKSSEAGRRATIAKIQIQCLLCIARHATGDNWSDPTWVAFSTLIPAAMVVGLHRDPSRLPPMSPATAELRRRLWTTILELSLNSTVDASQPVLFSLDEFDCELPANINDEQLDFESDSPPTPSDSSVFTQSSVQIALAKSFRTRMAILKHASTIRPSDREKAASLSADLVDAARALRTAIKTAQPLVPAFQRHYCDMIMTRYIFAHHLPILTVHDSWFCSLQTICIDTAFSNCYSILSTASGNWDSEPLMQALAQNQQFESQCLEFKRLLLCSSGIPRSNLKIASYIVAAEAYSMKTDQDILRGSRLLRCMEARLLLRGVLSWTEGRIRAGQRNVLDHTFTAAALALVNALIEDQDVDQAVSEHGANALQQGCSLLAEIVGGDQSQLRSASEAQYDIRAEDSIELTSWGLFTTDCSDQDWINFASEL